MGATKSKQSEPKQSEPKQSEPNQSGPLKEASIGWFVGRNDMHKYIISKKQRGIAIGGLLLISIVMTIIGYVVKKYNETAGLGILKASSVPYALAFAVVFTYILPTFIFNPWYNNYVRDKNATSS